MIDKKATDIGGRRELFVDDALIGKLTGKISLRLHKPSIRDDAFVTDRPWEGSWCGYITTFKDGDIFRMYYHAGDTDVEDLIGDSDESERFHDAYAESKDGITWDRPNLGIFEVMGSKDNNIVWAGPKGVMGFCPFKDDNPDCEPDALYKAVGYTNSCEPGLYAMKSADAIHWSLMQEDPIMTGDSYDSQNVVFWDTLRGEYRAYVRDFTEGTFTGFRGIKTAVSKDFLHWPEREWLIYPDSPEEQLYKNQVRPYYRAPHIFLGFPDRYIERPWSPTIEALPELAHRKRRAAVMERYGAAVTDGLFMASRDGKTFKLWDEAFIRPGLRNEGSWAYGDCYQAWGILETASSIPGAPNELSFYAVEHYWRRPAAAFRRYTLRIDGFVSAHAPLGGGELITEPIVFAGTSLHLNVSTSAGGSMRVELLDIDGTAIEGYSLEDCYEIVGDTLDYTVRWANGTDVTALAGKPVKLRFALKDADLYSYVFM